MSRCFFGGKGRFVALYLLILLAISSIQCKQVLVPAANGGVVLEELPPDDVEEFQPLFLPETDIQFELFTKKNPNESQILSFHDPDSITNSYYDRNLPTRFTIHGWTGDGESSMNARIRDAYLELGNFNVISVDWGAGAQTPNYVAARNRVGPAGTHVGAFIQYLSAISGATTTTMTIIGYSLGAHVAGFAGKVLTGRFRLGGIVALDAAGPLFDWDRPNQRLNQTDAIYVESIHTNTGMLGFESPLGNASFYPNFGRRQPGCGIDPAGGCAHGRSVRLFAESLNSEEGFYARQCRSFNDVSRGNCVQAGADKRMGGEPTDKGARGVYWLPTNGRAPFARGDSWLDQQIWSTSLWILVVSLCVGIPTFICVLIICYYTDNKKFKAFRCSQCPCTDKKKLMQERQGIVDDAEGPAKS